MVFRVTNRILADESIRNLAIDVVRPTGAVVDSFQGAVDGRVVDGVETSIQQIEKDVARSPVETRDDRVASRNFGRVVIVRFAHEVNVRLPPAGLRDRPRPEFRGYHV